METLLGGSPWVRDVIPGHSSTSGWWMTSGRSYTLEMGVLYLGLKQVWKKVDAG